MPAKETKAERLDRELGELLQELRVMLPGVQVLFAFLLTIPFTQRFAALTGREEGLYLTALLCAAVASVLLISPTAFHRLRFRERDKEKLIVTANRFAIAGTVFLAIAMTTGVFLVAELIFGRVPAFAAAAGLGILILVAWYALPLLRRAQR